MIKGRTNWFWIVELVQSLNFKGMFLLGGICGKHCTVRNIVSLLQFKDYKYGVYQMFGRYWAFQNANYEQFMFKYIKMNFPAI